MCGYRWDESENKDGEETILLADGVDGEKGTKRSQRGWMMTLRLISPW